MSQQSPVEAEAILARIAERTVLLRTADSSNESAEAERELVRDLAAVAAMLRQSTTSASVALARVLDSGHGPQVDALGIGLRKKRQKIDPLTRLAILRGEAATR